MCKHDFDFVLSISFSYSLLMYEFSLFYIVFFISSIACNDVNGIRHYYYWEVVKCQVDQACNI